MADPRDQELVDFLNRPIQAIEVDGLEFDWLTGNGTDADPQAGLDDGQIWIRRNDTRGGVPAVLSDRMYLFRRVNDWPVMVAYNHLKERTAYAPIVTKETSGALQRLMTIAFQAEAVTTDSFSELQVHQPDVAYAGLNVCVEAGLTPYGYLIRDHYDISTYLPPTTGKRWWVLAYVDTDGTVKFSTTGSVETDTPAANMVLDNGGSPLVAALENLTVSPGWIPRAGIVLENGQTAVDSSTRFVPWAYLFDEQPSGLSPLTTKGDIYTFSTVNARQPAGADGQIVGYDSATPTGLRAVNLPGGGGGGVITGVLPSTCQGRMTLTSNTPITTADVTAAATLYFDSYQGNVVALFDGSSTWTGYTFSELSLSLSGLLPHSIQDVFVYNNSGTPTLELTAWNAGATGAITNVTNANPPVVTSNSHGLSVDDVVTILGVVGSTGVNGTFRISAVTTNTYTLETLAAANPGAPGAYTSGGIWYKYNYVGSRATSLVLQDGVYVKNGATTRRYLGTIRITDTTGQTEDSLLRRYVWNVGNRVGRKLKVTDATNNFTYSTAAWRAWHNDFSLQAAFIIGLNENLLQLRAGALAQNSGGASFNIGMAFDATAVNNADIFPSSSFTAGVGIWSEYKAYPGVGFHFLLWVQYSNGGTTTWYGNAGVTFIQSGMVGEIAA